MKEKIIILQEKEKKDNNKLPDLPKIRIHNLISERIYSIINISRVKKDIQKGEWIYILSKKTKYYTKEILKYFSITTIAFGFIIAIILIKYKPVYEVKISGEEVGYIQNKNALEESIKESILNSNTNKNIDSITITENPEYELKLINRTQEINEEEIINKIEQNVEITYKYYEIALNNETIERVNTVEEAQDLVQTIKNEKSEDLDLRIIEKYTEKEEEAETTEIELAKTEIEEKITKIEEEKEKQEQEEKMPSINGVKLAVLPITGIISSRYGVSSSIRSSTHTGLDIAAPQGTPIKAVSEGTVTCASYNGSYGNLVKIDHGNGIETWYGHTSKMYVTVGQKVEAGEVIAAVGSTGNSTGPHLHLEIRINGQHVNPQQYLYK